MYMHILRRGKTPGKKASAGLAKDQREKRLVPGSKRGGIKKFFLLGLCVLVLAAGATGCRPPTDGSLRSGEYAGRLSLPEGGDIPCSVTLEVDGITLKGREIQLPFGGKIMPDAPISLRKKELGQTAQVTAGELALMLTLEDRQPQSEISDYEAARRAEHLCLAGSGDAFYHTGAFSCGRQTPGEPARYFSGEYEARLYGLSRCPHCLTEEGQPLEPAPDQQPEAAEPSSSAPAEPSSSQAASSQPASSRAASKAPAGQSGDKPASSENVQICKGLLCHDPSLPGWDYCAIHKCGVPDCGELRTGVAHCERHACCVYDCPNPNNGAIFSPCKEHTCHYPDCNEQAVELGGNCQKHLCRHGSGCKAGSIPGNNGFCDGHR